MNGQLFDEGRVESLVVGAMPVCPPLNIRLRTTPLRELQIRPRWACVCTEDTIIQYYGTLRRTSATHASSGALTDRNKHELPQCLYFDADFRTDWAARRHRELPMRMAVAPRFAEWLMGVPAGWTSGEPLEAAVRHEHIAFLRDIAPRPQEALDAKFVLGLWSVGPRLAAMVRPSRILRDLPHGRRVAEGPHARRESPERPRV